MGKFLFFLPNDDNLTRQQKRAVDIDEDTFVTGVAGTGKTTISIKRFLKTNNSILFTYGKLLAKSIQERIKTINKNKQVVNIHRWLYNSVGNKEMLEDNLSDINIQRTIDILKSKEIYFDNVFVDEGQDLMPNSYILFRDIAKNISISADEAQKVNEIDKAIDEKDILRIFPNIKQFTLTQVFRMTYEIYNFARFFLRDNVRVMDDNVLERLKRENSGGDKPFVYVVDNLDEAIETI